MLGVFLFFYFYVVLIAVVVGIAKRSWLAFFLILVLGPVGLVAFIAIAALFGMGQQQRNMVHYSSHDWVSNAPQRW
ncbi:hypothetical protein [Microbacterium sp. NPDC055455]